MKAPSRSNKYSANYFHSYTKLSDDHQVCCDRWWHAALLFQHPARCALLSNDSRPRRLSDNSDSIAVGIAGSMLATILCTPVAMFLIAYGFGRCQRLQLLPRLDRLHHRLGNHRFHLHDSDALDRVRILDLCSATPTALENNCRLFSAHRYIYVWWCCSLAHGEHRSSLSSWCMARSSNAMGLLRGLLVLC